MMTFLLLRPNLSQKGLHLATKTTQILEEVTTKFSGSPCNPKWGFSAIYALLEDYFNDEERLIRIAGMRIIDTVGREKAKLTSLRFKRSRRCENIPRTSSIKTMSEMCLLLPRSSPALALR